MPNIIVNGKTFTFDKIIYADGVNGLDTNDGLSELTPVKTLSKANTLSTNSNTSCIYLLGGEFTVNVFTLNGCLIGKNGRFPIVNYSAGASGYTTGIVFNTPNSTITGVIFKASGSFDTKYHFSNNATGVTIANCVFYNYTSCFKWFAYTNEITIKNCYFGESYSLAVLNAYSGGYIMSDNLFKTESYIDKLYYPINTNYQNVGVYSGELSWNLIRLSYSLKTNRIIPTTEIFTITLLSQKVVGNIVPDLNSFVFKIGSNFVYNGSISSSFPQNINIPLKPNLTRSIDGVDEFIILLNNLASTEGLVYFEEYDGLLNPITRDFKITDWVDKSNVAITPGTGISLTNQNRQGSVFTDVSVYRKSEVKKVTVDGDTDKVITGNFVFKPNFLDTYFYKNVITRPLGSKFTVMNYLMNTDLLYMKECVEVPGNTTITDNNDSTGNVINAGAKRTWILPSVGISSLYIKVNESSKIELYNSLDQLVQTNTMGNGSTTILVGKSDICKIVYTNTYQSALTLFTISAYGYDGKQFHLYSNPKYNIYAPVNAGVSKLVLEDTVAVTKDLVKSKKMGNLSFINNPSKVVVKKTSTSSNQTSSKIVRNKIDLANIPMRKIEVK